MLGLLPDEIMTNIFRYYMIGLRHRTNLRKIKELIIFTNGEPQMILDYYFNPE
jgi:hypothetical protein